MLRVTHQLATKAKYNDHYSRVICYDSHSCLSPQFSSALLIQYKMKLGILSSFYYIKFSVLMIVLPSCLYTTSCGSHGKQASIASMRYQPKSLSFSVQ